MNKEYTEEMEEILHTNGFDPEHAKALCDEGMGPEELKGRVAIKDGIGSLQYSHGFVKKNMND